jgi:hypothetical protein
LATRASCFSSLAAVPVGQTTRPCCPPSIEGIIKQRQLPQSGAKVLLSHENTMPLAYPTILRGPALASQCNQYGSTRGADSVIDTPHFLLHKARGSTCTRAVPPVPPSITTYLGHRRAAFEIPPDATTCITGSRVLDVPRRYFSAPAVGAIVTSQCIDMQCPDTLPCSGSTGIEQTFGSINNRIRQPQAPTVPLTVSSLSHGCVFSTCRYAVR